MVLWHILLSASFAHFLSLQHLSLVIKSSRPRPLALGNGVCERNLGNWLLAKVSPDGRYCEDEDGTSTSNDDAVEVRRLVDRSPFEVAQRLLVEAGGGSRHVGGIAAA